MTLVDTLYLGHFPFKLCEAARSCELNAGGLAEEVSYKRDNSGKKNWLERLVSQCVLFAALSVPANLEMT